MTLPEFLLSVLCVAIVLLLSIAVILLRDIRDGIDTLNAQQRLATKMQHWIRQEHEG